MARSHFEGSEDRADEPGARRSPSRATCSRLTRRTSQVLPSHSLIFRSLTNPDDRTRTQLLDRELLTVPEALLGQHQDVRQALASLS
ncbi:BQ5605_C031g11006 [Microbotryum silenes-dioicae]|uniref:BQ5605_C031g11006 protein n=1 Tax=Microbotryum silenes-dioicae TaxID=796604 RepID=A0A2X0PC47_9BASI|nr:BQ5605_C031g11006 [Microbotryum silenes-dioicae]